MDIGTGGHNTTTQGAAVALHIQTGNKSIKKSMDKTVTPNHVRSNLLRPTQLAHKKSDVHLTPHTFRHLAATIFSVT
jgi:hypothetical protein